jgi:hypothetical protein
MRHSSFLKTARIKLFTLGVLISKLISFVNCQQTAELITVEAQLNPASNTIYFNGNSYVLSSTSSYVYSGKPQFEVKDIPVDGSFAFHVLMTLLCVLCAALAAGLTMGLVSLEPFDMQILMEASVDDCLTETDRLELIKEKVNIFIF